MKGLLAGIIFIIVIGVAGFFYRNTFEHPVVGVPQPVACTTDAKLCPDGTSVGRSGPNCVFAPCALPNVEDAPSNLAFAIPAGYVANPNAIGSDESLRAVFDKPSKGELPHSIIVRRYPIEAGKTATSTILSHTMYESSGNTPKSLNEFRKRVINMRTFFCVTLERFEGQIHTACYLPRTSDVLKFEVLEKDVDWTNPALNIETLPEHSAFYKMLTTIQTP